jgi:hypothetical protein
VSGGETLKMETKMLINLSGLVRFGRCPVRGVFEVGTGWLPLLIRILTRFLLLQPALQILMQHQDLFKSFIQHIVSIEEAPKYYDLFDKRKVRKTVFKFD